MADQDQERKATEASAGQHNSVLDKQAQGGAGGDHGGRQGFTPGDGGQYRSDQQLQGESQSGRPGGGDSGGDVGRGALQGGQGATQQTFAQQGESDQQRFGLTSDQIGLNQQSYGQNVEQDTSGGLGPQEARLASAGSSAMLGEGPAQSSGQPSSPTTGGPDLSKGLADKNKGV